MKISVLILTLDEERNLPHCLAALAWCDDIVVVDSGSTDGTVAIARGGGAHILLHPFDNFAAQRNWGLENGNFRHDWVLHLDADEVVTPELNAALMSLTPIDGIDAYNLPSKMMLFGRWIRFAGMYPTYQVRLGHRDRLRFVQAGHGQREDLPVNRLGIIDSPYLHYSFSNGLFGWLNKHVRYARDEAAFILAQRKAKVREHGGGSAVGRRRSAKAFSAKLPVMLRPLLRFLYVYLVRQGFRDGLAGLAYAFMLAVYEGMTAILVLEAMLGGNSIPDHVSSSESSP